LPRFLNPKDGRLVFLAVVILTSGVASHPWSASNQARSAVDYPGVRVDNFGPTSKSQGIEPYVATSPNGTVFVSWIGIGPGFILANGSGSNLLNLQIWLSWSKDFGRSFSPPRQVSNSSYSCADPSMIIAPDGTIVLSYLVTSPNHSYVFVAVKSPSMALFRNIEVTQGDLVDRPWVTMDGRGQIWLEYTRFPEMVIATTPLTTLESSEKSPFSIVAQFGSGGSASGLLKANGRGTLFVPIFVEYQNYSLTGEVKSILAEVGTNGTTIAYAAKTVAPRVGTVFPSAFTYHPYPALAIHNQTLYYSFTSDQGRKLLITVSDDFGRSWSNPITLANSHTTIVQDVRLSINPSGKLLVASWEDNATGIWEPVCELFDTKFMQPFHTIRFSTPAGYSYTSTNWHGDYIGTSFSSGTNFILVWSSGYGLPDVYGFGHIYSSGSWILG
jgi:hypothetical protein